jgi:hypothetical protein
MMKRFKLAMRVLFGLPIYGVRVGESFLLDKGRESEADHTLRPPFDLCFDGPLECEPAEEVFADGECCSARFRVCVFREKKSGARWLVLELNADGKWYHLVTMHESRLAVMLDVLGRVRKYLGGSPPGVAPDGRGRCDQRPQPAGEEGRHLRVVRGPWAAQVWRFPRTLGQNIFFVDLLPWSDS